MMIFSTGRQITLASEGLDLFTLVKTDYGNVVLSIKWLFIEDGLLL